MRPRSPERPRWQATHRVGEIGSAKSGSPGTARGSGEPATATGLAFQTAHATDAHERPEREAAQHRHGSTKRNPAVRHIAEHFADKSLDARRGGGSDLRRAHPLDRQLAYGFGLLAGMRPGEVAALPSLR
ncbi:MAG: hypothetical protein KF773_32465, partial [Deltaproteobacteria bacterium]|nr:hypothetical protein [Deltaproteobacteria bacterium]